MENITLNSMDGEMSEDLEILKRSEITEISEYFNEVIGSLEYLEYKIEGKFDSQILSDFLMEDLPSSSEESLKKALVKDILSLIQTFDKKSKAQNILLRLEPVSHDLCRLFHVDKNRHRMICTYRGPGTEWLEETNVFRKGLGSGDNTKIVKDFQKIKTTNPFDVLILKGKMIAGDSRGAVHRSPEISGSKQVRVLLKIDEI